MVMGVLTCEGETDGRTDRGHMMAPRLLLLRFLLPLGARAARTATPRLSPESILMNLMTEERQQQNNQGISLDERMMCKGFVPPLTLYEILNDSNIVLVL